MIGVGVGTLQRVSELTPTVSCASGCESLGSHLVRQRHWDVECQSIGLVSQSACEAQRGRCALQVGVIVTPRVRLKRIRATTYITKGALSFLGAHSYELRS